MNKNISEHKIILQAVNINKSFKDANGVLPILKNISLSVREHEFVAIMGSSGSGKSTLMHILGGLDKADSGEIILKNQKLSSLSEKSLCKLRNQELGFVYQFHHLLPEFTALENVAMPLLINKTKSSAAFKAAKKILSDVGVTRQATHKTAELSGGERQRVAIARALVAKPSCLLADEPTGNLDSKNAEKIFTLMRDLSAEYACGFVIVTHDAAIANQCDRVLELVDGVIN